LYLDDPAVRDNEVFVDENSKMQIGSFWGRAGRFLLQVKGAFETRLESVALRNKSTEFEIVINPDGTSKITVLEGAVTADPIQTTRFKLERKPSEFDLAELTPDLFGRFFPVSYSQQRAEPNVREFVATSGKVLNLEEDFLFKNRCEKPHHFEIYSPPNLRWFSMLGADQFQVEAQQSRVIRFAIKINATHVSPAEYTGDIIARCVDCTEAEACGLGGLLLHVRVKILGTSSDTTPTPVSPALPEPAAPLPASPTNRQSATAEKLGQIVITNANEFLEISASDADLKHALDWTTPAILNSQPSYIAESVVPRFATNEIRREVFRDARSRAVLTGDAGSYAQMGDAYLDWQNGVQALKAYELVRARDIAVTSHFLTGYGEAYRLTGDLTQAERVLKGPAERDQWAPALNALGNVYLDQARAARDQADAAGATRFLELAQIKYEQAITVQAQSTTRHHAQRRVRPITNVDIVANANLGEVHLQKGEMLMEAGETTEAANELTLAHNAYSESQKKQQDYPFSISGRGDVYRAQAKLAAATTNNELADKFAAQAQQQYSQVISLHGDMAEALVGLGRLYEQTGRPEAAIRQYMRAAEVRPEQPEPHYRLAISLAKINPLLAAEHARAFQKLEREPLRQGEKNDDVKDVISRTYQAKDTSIKPKPNTPTGPTPPPPVPPVSGPTTLVEKKVPEVKGDLERAKDRLRTAGFQWEISGRFECKPTGKVVDSNPKQGSKARLDQPVTLFVSLLADAAPTVPDLYSKSWEEAQGELSQRGLRAKRKNRETDQHTENTVFGQNRNAGERLNAGCQVELTVAVPIPPVFLPNFVGQPADQVLSQLTPFGDLVRGTVSEELDERCGPSVVKEQFPASGMVPRGTVVNLTITKPDLWEVPQIEFDEGGKPMDDKKAMSIIWNARLVPEPQGQGNIVDKQSPAAGTKVCKGSKVFFTKKYPPVQ
jgi:beta-lactam-binding protein with PASTA domain/tetratricopeptide (TPR) repeat protein